MPPTRDTALPFFERKEKFKASSFSLNRGFQIGPHYLIETLYSVIIIDSGSKKCQMSFPDYEVGIKTKRKPISAGLLLEQDSPVLTELVLYAIFAPSLMNWHPIDTSWDQNQEDANFSCPLGFAPNFYLKEFLLF